MEGSIFVNMGILSIMKGMGFRNLVRPGDDGHGRTHAWHKLLGHNKEVKKHTKRCY